MVTPSAHPAHPLRPTDAQRRILSALNSRPAARILTSAYGGYLITDGRGWSPKQDVTYQQLYTLMVNGWVTPQMHSYGRKCWVLTAAGREALQPRTGGAA